MCCLYEIKDIASQIKDIVLIVYYIGMLTIAAIGVFFGLRQLRNMHKTMALSKLDTFIKIESSLHSYDEKMAVAYQEYQKSDNDKHKYRIYVESYRTYNNTLDRICFFILSSGKSFMKKIRPEFYPYLKKVIKLDHDISKSDWDNIKRLYGKWDK